MSGGGKRYATSRGSPRRCAGHRLVDAEHTALLTTGRVKATEGPYAYGFMDRSVGGMRMVGHGGGALGMNGDLMIEPKSGTVVAVLANMDPPAASRVSTFIGSRVSAKGASAVTP